MSAKEPRDGGGAGKEGSGRVGVYRSTGLPHTFTLECNYNTGRVVNRIAHPHSASDASLSPQPPLRCLSPKYTTETWHSVGKARRPPRCNPMRPQAATPPPRLQPHAPQAATPCAPGCNLSNPTRPRLQPCASEAATLCVPGTLPCGARPTRRQPLLSPRRARRDGGGGAGAATIHVCRVGAHRGAQP